MDAVSRRLHAVINSLEGASHEFSSLSLSSRYMLSELMMVRLSIALDTFIEQRFCDVACGRRLPGGRVVPVSIRASSRQQAKQHFSSHGRSEEILLRWTSSRSIRKNIENIILPRDPLHATVMDAANTINQIRSLRNHVAHKSISTRNKYQSTISARLGAPIPRMAVGQFLLKSIGGRLVVQIYFRERRALIAAVNEC